MNTTFPTVHSQKIHKSLFLYGTLVLLLLWNSQTNYCSSNSELNQKNPCVYSAVLHDVSYHSQEEGNISPDYFHDILKMIHAAKKQTVLSSEVVWYHNQKSLHKINNSILITFDDGWAGIYKHAHPLLKKYGMKATAFIPTNEINKNSISKCSWRDLRTMTLSGNWEIHSHSATHADLTTISKLQLNYEMTAPINHFRQNGFIHDLFIAYPFGAHSIAVQDGALKCGYKAGFAALPKVKITPQDDLYALPRSTICQLFDQPMVCRKLGLNLDTVRNKIAIFDETEGKWSGKWQHHFFHDEANPGFTCGQLGYRYAVSQSREASWQIKYDVDQPGFYSISTWTPVIENQKFDKHNWEVFSEDNQLVCNGSIHHKKQNGWTTLSTIWLNKGEVTLSLKTNSTIKKPLLVDAVKIERKL